MRRINNLISCGSQNIAKEVKLTLSTPTNRNEFPSILADSQTGVHVSTDQY